MDPIQKQPVGDLELTSPASGATPPAPAPAAEPTPQERGEQEFQQAGKEWIDRLTGADKETAPPPVVAKPEAPTPHPQNRLNPEFRDRINRGARLRAAEELSRKQAATIEKLQAFLAPLMEEQEPEAPALEMLDPAEADPKEWWARNLELLREEIRQEMAPVLDFVGQQRETREQAAARQQELQHVVQALQERQEDLSFLENEYAGDIVTGKGGTEEGRGYYERFKLYAQTRAQFLINAGFPPDAARQRVHQMMEGIMQMSQQLPGGPVHPIVWLDRVMQHEYPQLAQVGRNGHAAPAGPVGGRQPAPAAATPPTTRQSTTAAELRAAAASGAAGSIGSQGAAPARGGDLAAAIASGKMNPQKMAELLRGRHGGKLPSNMTAALAELNAEIVALQQQAGR